MSSSKGKRHTHKYYRVELSPNQFVWACAHGDCPHHMPSHYEATLLNKNYFCWECGKLSTLRTEHLRLNRDYFTDDNLQYPRCNDCKLGIRTDIDEEVLDDLMRKVIGDK